MMRYLVRNILKTNIYGFSEQSRPQKNINKYLKVKKTEAIVQKKQEEQIDEQALQIAHRMLYIQFIPSLIIAGPLFYYFTTPIDPGFINGCNLLQYYSSGLLCFNVFFTKENKGKYMLFLMGVAAANCLTGPISIATPIILGLLNMYFPFTHEKYHKGESVEQSQSYKSYMGVQAVCYFMMILLITLKGYHFVSVREVQKKLKNYQKENQEYYQKMQLVNQV